MRIKRLLHSKMTYVFLIAIVLGLLAKFYIGFYQIESNTQLFIKPSPVWKSYFYSPVSAKGRNLTLSLTEEEQYEQEMFNRYASDDFLKIVACGDIFSHFSNKPMHMEYIGCDIPLAGKQSVAVSNYRVTGENVLEIESYLTEHHFMPPMKAIRDWGYETRSVFGDVGNRELEERLKLISPAILVDIEMSGIKAEKDIISYDRYGSKLADIRSSIQKEEVPYYFISVNLLKI